MIIAIHNGFKIKRLEGTHEKVILNSSSIIEQLSHIALKNPDMFLIWVHEDFYHLLNVKKLAVIFHNSSIMASYSGGKTSVFLKTLGYVDQSIFLNVNKKVKYPSWFMHTLVGGIHASVINLYNTRDWKIHSFSFFLNAISKQVQVNGLFCYSEPDLLLPQYGINQINREKISNGELFHFVAMHYKKKWLLLLLYCLIRYENKWPILSFIKSIRVNKNSTDVILSESWLEPKEAVVKLQQYDLIIPTIGRKSYLHDVFKDMTAQTVLPNKVIIVEQNIESNATSELDFISEEEWPFEIKHIFTHVAGACNARNIALQFVESKYVIFGDDDCRYKSNDAQKMISSIIKFDVAAINVAALQPHEKQTYLQKHQTSIFGSGSSIINRALLPNLKFDMLFEFGFGEDLDFGMQIRNAGHDVIYDPKNRIDHLKAPTGGFRVNIEKPWNKERVQPIPSPTMSIYNLKYKTKQQIRSYKIMLFIKQWKAASFWKKFSLIMSFKYSWDTSMKWALILMHEKA